MSNRTDKKWRNGVFAAGKKVKAVVRQPISEDSAGLMKVLGAEWDWLGKNSWSKETLKWRNGVFAAGKKVGASDVMVGQEQFESKTGVAG